MLSRANPADAIYVPFIGDGDIADACYSERQIYGADLDPKRVATAQKRLSDAQVIVGDCDDWPFAGRAVEPVSVADFDAYGNPYKGFLSFWRQAPKFFPMVCFFTDGLRLRVQRGDVVWDWATQKAITSESPNQARAQFNFWFKRHALPYVQQIVTPHRIIDTKFYLRRHMVYWGCVIDQ